MSKGRPAPEPVPARSADPRELLARAEEIMAHDRASLHRIQAMRARLDGALRVALAGGAGSGKSTLLNALLGEHVAPTDGGEPTRVVIWYRSGSIPGITVYPRVGHGSPIKQPVRLVDGRLSVSTGGLDPADVDRIEIRWPAPALSHLTLIDTPGVAPLPDELGRPSSPNTSDVSISEVDAVIQLLRYDETIRAEGPGSLFDQPAVLTAPTTVAVLSRVDEASGGRLDSLLAAAQTAQQYRNDPRVRSLFIDIVPVAGLLAQDGDTVDEAEVEAIRALSELRREDLEDLLSTPDRFRTDELPHCPAAPPEVRARLLPRWGVFGVRLAVLLVREGFDTAASLGDELVRRSGIDQVSRLLHEQLTLRANALKARSALVVLRHELGRRSDSGDVAARDLADTVEAALASRHELEELQLLCRLRASASTQLTPAEVRAAETVLGGGGLSPADRLRRPHGTSSARLLQEALSQIRRWRARQGDPDCDDATRDACRTVIRSLEGVVAALSGRP